MGLIKHVSYFLPSCSLLSLDSVCQADVVYILRCSIYLPRSMSSPLTMSSDLTHNLPGSSH